MNMAMRLISFCTALSVPLVLTGCGYLFGDEGMFRDQSEDYKDARELPKTEVPEGSDSEALGEIYPIPPVRSDVVLAGEFEVPRPQPLVAGTEAGMVRIQKLGDASWALVSIPPGQLWPQVRGFLAGAGLPVQRVDAQAGLIETDWVPLEGESLQSRFRFRIERGVQRGTSELHILQMNQSGEPQAWPEQSDDIELESRVLRQAAQYIANSAGEAPVSMIADRAISAGGRISLEEAADGTNFIRVGLPFARAWASLALALEASSFEVTDLNRSEGRYYVRFSGEEEEKKGGWFGWLFGGGNDDPLAGREFLVTVSDSDEESVDIHIRATEGDPPLEKAQRQGLLNLIKGNIS